MERTAQPLFSVYSVVVVFNFGLPRRIFWQQIERLSHFPYRSLVFAIFSTTDQKTLLTEMSRKRNASPQSSQTVAKKPFWSLGLLDTIKDPSQHVLSDDLVVVINDKYPKAMFHYLVLPRENISSLKKLEKKHLNLLKHMDKVGEELTLKHPDSSFKMGYHAEPSMHHLHLHVISDDFVSPALKTKKHWNSFNTEHFILSSKLIKAMEETGKPIIMPASHVSYLMNSPLQCHKCSFAAKNIPKLKEHLLSHTNKKK